MAEKDRAAISYACINCGHEYAAVPDPCMRAHVVIWRCEQCLALNLGRVPEKPPQE
ncbi:MAG: hypothetical protein HYY16_08645 [Planctomycetes bacterium]|nr:hypothetical protein [Planctomycetota bacterium]